MLNALIVKKRKKKERKKERKKEEIPKRVQIICRNCLLW